jgi:hypothetical protein
MRGVGSRSSVWHSYGVRQPGILLLPQRPAGPLLASHTQMTRCGESYANRSPDSKAGNLSLAATAHLGPCSLDRSRAIGHLLTRNKAPEGPASPSAIVRVPMSCASSWLCVIRDWLSAIAIRERQEAPEFLAPVCSWSTEDFDTLDLKARSIARFILADDH